jgi:hypothetical protein
MMFSRIWLVCALVLTRSVITNKLNGCSVIIIRFVECLLYIPQILKEILFTSEFPEFDIFVFQR